MQFFIKKQHKTLTNDGRLNIIIRFGAIDAKWEAWAKEFFMFEYVTKAEYQPVREELERILIQLMKNSRKFLYSYTSRKDYWDERILMAR